MSLCKRRDVLLLAVISAFLGLSGCDALNLNQKPNKATRTVTAQKNNRVPVHRFVPVRNNYDVAFDTQTGQLCRTWVWLPTGKPPKPDPETGNAPQRTLGEFAPTCLYLYEQYPSGMDTQSESMPDEQPVN